MHVEKLTAERESLTVGTEKKKVEHDTLAARIRELKVVAATKHRELGIVVRVMLSSRAFAADDEDRANAAVARARETLYKMYEFRKLVRAVNRNVGGKRLLVVRLVDAELLRVRPVITAALLESEGTVCEAIYDL